jgi:hypothetical protein
MLDKLAKMNSGLNAGDSRISRFVLMKIKTIAAIAPRLIGAYFGLKTPETSRPADCLLLGILGGHKRFMA